MGKKPCARCWGLKDEEDGWKSALWYAAEVGIVGCVNVLLDEGADGGLVDESGYTALHGACLGVEGGDGVVEEDVGDNVKVVTVLLGAGADVNTR